VQVGAGQIAVLFFLSCLAFSMVFIQLNKIEKLLRKERGQRSPAVRLVLALPIVITKEKQMPNYELNVGNTAYVPIETLDAGGKPVPPPTGDTFTVVSSNPTAATATVGTMPSGPLSGAAAAVIVGLTVAAGITVTLTDADGLTADVQIVDVIPALDPPTTDFLDISDAVVVTTPPAGSVRPA
jgi:hypothetical protein